MSTPELTSMIAVVPVRDGAMPAGGHEAVAEAGGDAILVGDGTDRAASALTGSGRVRRAEWGAYAPGAWARSLAGHFADHGIVILPASADGRDLAPRVAHALGRPLLAGAVSIQADRVVLARAGARVAETHHPRGPVVATLLPGVRGVQTSGDRPQIGTLPAGDAAPRNEVLDAVVLEVLPADPATMDLSEARRVLAGGAGLGGAHLFSLLAEAAAGLGATPGATRVVADAGWVPAHRYIGTTGVSIDPDLYVAVGISGAVQHVTGIGHPRHVVAVNNDPSAPMMGLADLAVVTDGPAFLAALVRSLGAGIVGAPPSGPI